MCDVKLLSRHAVGTSGRQGQLVVKAIGLYRKRLCLRVAVKTAVGDICARLICWASPEDQRVKTALLKIEKAQMKVEHSSQERPIR